jgi:hypothetical protein
MAGDSGGCQHRAGVSLHEAHQAALRDLCRGEQRAAREVRRRDESHLLFPAVTADPEGMQERQDGQVLRVELPRLGAETLKENVKRRPVIEAVDLAIRRHDCPQCS